jgi:hypothetical protein
MKETKNLKNTCFVCRAEITAINSTINQEVYLPVCNNCQDSENEKKAVKEQLDSLADGFVCGCI